MIARRFSPLPDWMPAFRELNDLRRDMDRLFSAWGEEPDTRTAGVFPPMNVAETADGVVVRAELPGISPDDLEVTVENGTLTIAGEREAAKEAEGASFHRREREWGRFRRSITMPTQVDRERVRADYTNGILTVELPKAPEARPRQIAIQAGS